MVGELGLDGRVRPVRGALVAALAARRAGATSIVVPSANVDEAALVPDIAVHGVRTLAGLVALVRGDDVPEVELLVEDDDLAPAPTEPDIPDLADVRGQHDARSALELAAAGGHHLAMSGLPGVGKTMLAERLPGLLPPLDEQAALEVTAIHSVAGRLGSGGRLITVPPFEAPHHTASHAAMVGGGSGVPRIGLVSLAHRGVLFLDEAPEFDAGALDSLRQPLESGEMVVARSGVLGALPRAVPPRPGDEPVPVRPRRRGRRAPRAASAHRSSAAAISRASAARCSTASTSASRWCARRWPTSSSATPTPSPPRSWRRACSRRANGPRDGSRAPPGASTPTCPAPSYAGCTVCRPTRLRRSMRRISRGQVSARGADRIVRVAWTVADLAGRDRPILADVGPGAAAPRGRWAVGGLSDRAARALLSRVAEPGDRQLAALLAHQSAAEVVERLRADADPALDRFRSRLPTADPEADLARAADVGGRLLVPGDLEWPTQLADLGDAEPWALWVRGSADLRMSALRSVAVVGARAATSYGTHVASGLGADLAAAGWTVVSGGAFGIDAAAHAGALAAHGATVAVLACGVDVAYPPRHDALFARIAGDGLLVSEVPPGAAPHRGRFLVRNRLIAALTRGHGRGGGGPALGRAVHRTRRRAPRSTGPRRARSGDLRDVARGPPRAASRRDPGHQRRRGDRGGRRAGRRPRRPSPPARSTVRDALDPLSARVLDGVPARRPATVESVARTAGVTASEAPAALGLLELAGIVRLVRDGWVLTR